MKTKNFILFIALFLILAFTTTNVKILSNAQSLSSEIIVEVSSNRVLFEKNARVIRPMASTTKIVTALTVLNSNIDLNKKVLIKKQYCGIEGSSVYLKEGESLTIGELLYALMLRSGNDSAVALACETAGSLKEFSKLMNSLANSLGAKNSNFTNPHGLHDDSHYTTAYDLAIISAAAMKNTEFRKIVGSISHKIGEGDSLRYLVNKNKMLKEFQGATGIKTGFTKKAGRCLVSSAKKDNMEVVCVVLNCAPMFERSKELLNSSFNEYEMLELFSASDFDSQALVEGTTRACKLYCEKSFSYPIKKDELDKIEIKKIYPDKLTPPFEADQCVGKISIYLQNQLLFSENIYTIIGVKSKDYRFILNDVARLWNIS